MCVLEYEKIKIRILGLPKNSDVFKSLYIILPM